MRYLLLPALLIAACSAATAPVWIKPGTALGQADSDLAACQRSASRQFPERPRIAASPAVTIGGRVCEGPFCVGVQDAVDVFDQDTNAPLRDQAVAACMGAKGYALANLPRCSGPSQVLVSQPFDTRGLCSANGQAAAPR